MFFCGRISLVQKKVCTSFPQTSFPHMVLIKILFPVQASPLSGYRFPICRCLKYCQQKNHPPMWSSASGHWKIRPPVFWNTPTALHWIPQSLPLICSLQLWIPAYTATFSQITERLQRKIHPHWIYPEFPKHSFRNLKKMQILLFTAATNIITAVP